MSSQSAPQSSKTIEGIHAINSTQVPDDIFDEILPTLNLSETRVLFYIIRRTFGFKKSCDHISLSQMLDGIVTRDGRVLDRGTGLSKKSLLGALRSLQARHIIIATRSKNSKGAFEPTTYELNIVENRVGGDNTPTLGGESIPTGRGRKYTIQETALQQTELQSSKSSNVKKDGDVKLHLHHTDSSTHHLRAQKSREVRSNISKIGNVIAEHDSFKSWLNMRRSKHSKMAVFKAAARDALEEATTHQESSTPPFVAQKTTPAKSAAPLSRKMPGTLPASIESLIDEISEEFGNESTKKSNRTHVGRLYAISDLSVDGFEDRLIWVRSLTREKRRLDGLNRPMAWFFATLQDRLGGVGISPASETPSHQAVADGT